MNHSHSGSAGLISIITPAYNTEKYIDLAIRSVLNQTYRNFEYILVDDGSTDKTGEIIDRYAAQDSRIRVIHKENGGVSSARNAGLAAATGEYIAWLDSDDSIEPDMLETCLNALLEYDVPAALANYTNITPAGKRTLRNNLEDEITVLDKQTTLEWLFSSKIASVLCANVMRRSVYDGVVFPEGKIYEDVMVLYEMYDRMDRIVVMKKSVLNRQLRPDSITGAPTLENRVSSCNAHLARQEIIAKRWPQLDCVFVRYRYVQLLKLRHVVLHSPLKEWFRYRKDIRRFAAYFRKNGKYVLDQFPGILPKVEYFFLTCGTLPGFCLSRIVSLPKKGGSWLKK